MSLVPYLPGLLALMMVLAGCVASSDEEATEHDHEEGEEHDEEGEGGQEGEEGEGGAAAQVEPPIVVATVTGEDVVENATENGTTYEATAPIEILFDASGSSDPAGGNLTFAWEFSDGTTAEGTNATFNFTAGGTFTVNLTASSDASNLTSDHSLTIVVAEPVAMAAVVEFTADTDVRCPHCYQVGPEVSVSVITGSYGIDSNLIEFGPGFDGLPFTGTSTAGDMDIRFYDVCEGSELEAFDVDGPEEGVVPVGATCGWVYNFSADGTTLILTIGGPVEE